MRSEHKPKAVIVLGGPLDVPAQMKMLEHTTELFILAGTARDQQKWLDAFQPKRYKRLQPATNTKEEAAIALAHLTEHQYQEPDILAAEYHIVRATLTFIAACLRENYDVRLVPLAFLDSDRQGMPPVIRSFGVLSEAVKLNRYQKRGDVATFEQALWYQQKLAITRGGFQ